MPRQALAFAEGFYVSESAGIANKRCVNFRPVVLESPGLNNRALFGSDGIKEFADFGSGSSRGAIKFSDGTAYRVIGNSLISISSLGVISTLGTITGSTEVSMASNGINIAIQDPEGDSYFYTPGTTTLELNNSAVFLSFGQAETVAFKDGYYVYNTSAKIFSGSAKTTNDGKNFTATDFADAEISPDEIVKVHNSHNELQVMGEWTTEKFSTTATSGFPFERIGEGGAMVQKGCAARNSVIDFAGTYAFLGGGKDEKPSVYLMYSQPIKISTAAIDQMIHKNAESVISNATAFSYSSKGNNFYVLTVGNNTFVYDFDASTLAGSPVWHERQTGVTNGEGFQVWRARHGLKVDGEIQVADDRSGKIGRIDSGVYTEYGDRIEKFFTTKPFIADGDPIFSREVELEIESGVGDGTTDDPQIRFDYSDNGGKTFSNEVSRSMGKVGEYKERLRWSRLGRIPNHRQLRYKCSESVKCNVYNLFANAESINSG